MFITSICVYVKYTNIIWAIFLPIYIYRTTIAKYSARYRAMKEVNAFLLVLVGFICTVFLIPASDVSFSDSEKWYSLISLERKSPPASQTFVSLDTL